MLLDYKITISDPYLLGLIEGEGSFHFIRTRAIAGFDIKLTAKQKPLLLSVKRYLEEKLRFDSNSLWKINNSHLININSFSAKGNTNPQVSLSIENIRILYNYLIPYLSKLLF
jgi:LAGLIDADG DNA endonuclease family protein